MRTMEITTNKNINDETIDNYLGRPENGTNYMEFGNRQLPQHQSGFFNRVSAKNKDNQ